MGLWIHHSDSIQPVVVTHLSTFLSAVRIFNLTAQYDKIQLDNTKLNNISQVQPSPVASSVPLLPVFVFPVLSVHKTPTPLVHDC